MMSVRGPAKTPPTAHASLGEMLATPYRVASVRLLDVAGFGGAAADADRGCQGDRENGDR
jgi:hypothetical protein